MSETKPKVIVGLGNIGTQYANTRHNVGFIMVDALATQLDARWQDKAKFHANLAEARINEQTILLAKPTTYYNLSGQSVAALCGFYKLEASDLLVIHDELALPFGTIRSRLHGGDAGNNGIKSLISHLGPDFARIRIGIANQLLGRTTAEQFVLSRFSAEEQIILPQLTEQVIRLARQFMAVDQSFQHASITVES